MNDELEPEIMDYLGSLLDEGGDEPVLDGMVVMDCWRIGAKIGEGGTSDVYRAVNERDGSVASVKVLREATEANRRRFAFECELLERRGSKALPRLLGSGEIDGRPYVLTELLEPVDLPEDEKGIAEYVLEVCACVGVLHAAGIVHRDVKPQNVMRRANGEIVLIDLGLAKDVETSPFARDGVSIVDGKAVAAGTPGYAAPEQFTGGAVTVQTDIHGLGMLLYTCLTNCKSLWVPGDDPIPKRWQEIVRRALCTVPEERYASVGEFAAAIRNRGHRRAKVAAVAGLVVVLAAIWFATKVDWTGYVERLRWNSLCENVVTNVVSQELVREEVKTNGVGMAAFVDTRKWFRTMTNAVKAVRVDLKGAEYSFSRPVVLERGRVYYLNGPGKLDAGLAVESGRDGAPPPSASAVLHLSNCVLINRSRVPVRTAGIQYSLDGNCYLDFAALDRYVSADRDCIRVSDGKTNEFRFMGPESKEGLRKLKDEEAESRLFRSHQ